MTETMPPLFDADTVTAGCVAMNGSCVAIEFVGGGQRLWVTLPTAQLAQIEKLCADLGALGIDAKNGVANGRWHTTVE